jgi:uncharacterized protein (TIGR02996 family)
VSLTNHDDERGLLEAVAAEPEDDTPRLVYADWLDENAEHFPTRAASMRNRAEFVRCQIRAARGTDADGSAARRADELLRLHRAEWAGHLCGGGAGFGIESVSWDRGVITGIRLRPVEKFLENAERLFLVEPAVTSLAIRGKIGSYFFQNPHYDALLASPYLSKITELRLNNSCAGDEELRRLAGSERASNLRLLDLRSLAIHDSGVEALVSPGWRLNNLKVLVLSDNGLDTPGARALAGSPYVSTLTALDLSGNFIGFPGVRALANSPHLAHLERLDLRDNHIGAAGVRALAQSPHFRPEMHVVLDIGEFTMAGLHRHLGCNRRR